MEIGVCSWSCLGVIPAPNPQLGSNSTPIFSSNTIQNPNLTNNHVESRPNYINNQAPISYIDKVRMNQPIQIDVAALPSPIFVEGVPTITLSRAVLERGKKYCEFALIGRVDFNKVSLKRLHEIAKDLWLPTGDWKITPLGRGFFMFRLESRNDFIRIWSQAWKIGNQTLHFLKWTPDFDVEKQQTSNALLWVQFPRLGQQYWDYEALMTIRKGLGTPIGVDKKTLSREIGYFANVLIDVDMSKMIPSTVKVIEDDGKQFMQEVCVPKIPLFCSHCKSVGHAMYECRRLMREIQTPNDTVRGNSAQQHQAAQQNRNYTTSNAGNVPQNPIPVMIPISNNSLSHNPAPVTNAAGHSTPTQTYAATSQNNETSSSLPLQNNPNPVTLPIVSQPQNNHPNLLIAPSISQPLSVQNNGTEPHQAGQSDVQMQDITSTAPVAEDVVEAAAGPHHTPCINSATSMPLQHVNITSVGTNVSSSIQTQGGAALVQVQTPQITQLAAVLLPDRTTRPEFDAREENPPTEIVAGGYGISSQPSPGLVTRVHRREVQEEGLNQLNVNNNDNIPGTTLVVPFALEESPGASSARNNQPISTFNAFQLLGESDPIPESMEGVLREVNMVTQRMDALLDPARSATTSKSNKNRNSVHAFSLGPRRSKRFL